MKRVFSLIVAILFSIFLLAGCGGDKFEDLKLNVTKMTVSSSSINSEGKLYTITAANQNPNDPKGENKSPNLEWEKIENAACYAVVMFDTSANWLHMFLPDVTVTELEEGKFTETSIYIGAYPPINSGAHEYRIEIFALKEKPHNLVFIIDKTQNYKDIVKALDRYNAQNGNVLARGYITATYTNGDNTVR